MDQNALTPGLMIIHANHSEDLRDVLVNWVQRHPLAPLEKELVLVQSNGISQWLKLALAEPVRRGGVGIAASMDTLLPSRFLWQAYRAVLGEDTVPPESPFDKPLLTWRLMRLLPALIGRPAFAPLARFLEDDDDGRKCHQLSARLADLFDQYQVYRADWLADWAAGSDSILTSRRGAVPLDENNRWQSELWRVLLEDVGEQSQTSRAAVHQRFMQAVEEQANQPRPRGLPRRLLVFGLSSLPQQGLEVLAAIAKWTQVLMCVHNPCEHYWGNIIADKDLLRAERRRQQLKPGQAMEIPDDALHLHAHPLLAAWGKQGRDFIGLLDDHDQLDSYQQHFLQHQQRVDLFRSMGEDRLLGQLQDDIRDLRPRSESRERWPAVPVADESIRFHVVHSAQREVEVLHDQILNALSEDPTLRPRDIIVMVPDINVYAHHVQAVFGLHDRHDSHHVPFSLSDRSQRQQDPVLNAFDQLLSLGLSRISVSDVMDMLEVAALRARFGIEEADIPVLHRWISQANVRWGLHAEQRGSLALPEMPEQNSWLFGVRRMLLGYATGNSGAWQGIEPLDEVGGLEARLLGPLVQLLAMLEQSWRWLVQSHSVSDWCQGLRQLLNDFFLPEDARSAVTLEQITTVLDRWQAASELSRFAAPFPVPVVREHLLSALEESGLSQPFFAGSVTFATLMPMRAIPFRRIYLLGMNDGDYPRNRIPMDFDLMGQDYRPGDRSRREDDRYLFLEALLSAREHLHISWIGRSIHDNTERPPSVLVAQLRDHLEATWQTASATPLLDQLTLWHPLQPFSKTYFTANSGFFSYASQWRSSHDAKTQDDNTQPLPAFAWEEPLTLRLLSDFLRDPAKSFLRGRLGVSFERDALVSEDIEPFALDGLTRWQLQNELIQLQRLAVDSGEAREPALQLGLERIQRRGELSAGQFAALQEEVLKEPMETLFDEYRQACERYPHLISDLPINQRFTLSSGAAFELEDWLDQCRSSSEIGGQQQTARIILSSTGMLDKQQYRLDKLLPYWLAHVAGSMVYPGLETLVISKNGTVRMPALGAGFNALGYLSSVIEAWHLSLHRPLGAMAESSFAYIKAGGGNSSAEGEMDEAIYRKTEEAFLLACERSPYAARLWSEFSQMLASGDWFSATEKLYRPMIDSIGQKAAKAEATEIRP
ncbi:exodeoxyribonuclease V subunit gamma [Pokkaliibacter sp. CJK22405]|uniref:exodeoxyribonuclease V subunit gamma n=1 Tax=Pokkaliibacter sp. CJK22405 TaxID=3384615 RepID=UPI003984F6F1